jgi:TatD DNase family protein
MARRFELPVIFHVRRSQDIVLKHLRRARVSGGIAHAFNGSLQQAQAFVALGFALGFGGAMTFERALRIRALVRDLPREAHVLETDSPTSRQAGSIRVATTRPSWQALPRCLPSCGGCRSIRRSRRQPPMRCAYCRASQTFALVQ